MIDELKIGDNLKIGRLLPNTYTAKLIYIPKDKSIGKYVLFIFTPAYFGKKFFLSREQLQEEFIKKLN